MNNFRHLCCVKKIVFSAWSIILAMLVFSCGPKKEPYPVSNEEISFPYQEFTNTVQYWYDGSHKQWKLEADYMRRDLDSEGKVLAAPVVLVFYDSLGVPGTRILADSGTTNSKQENFTVWGNVYIRTRQGRTIQTSKLWWKQALQKVYSDAYVQITTETGDVLRGRGLEAHESFNEWSLKENVSGKFPKFKTRAKEEDEFFK